MKRLIAGQLHTWMPNATLSTLGCHLHIVFPQVIRMDRTSGLVIRSTPSMYDAIVRRYQPACWTDEVGNCGTDGCIVSRLLPGNFVGLGRAWTSVSARGQPLMMISGWLSRTIFCSGRVNSIQPCRTPTRGISCTSSRETSGCWRLEVTNLPQAIIALIHGISLLA